MPQLEIEKENTPQKVPILKVFMQFLSSFLTTIRCRVGFSYSFLK